ncbi:MAG: DUF885 domain-containing protein [Nocardioidaceae bacterium]|nr:MAG: DUF885 domain-containing protein [Nocardioidaceae bacterium]
MSARPVDDLCDQFVADYAAADPMAATAMGIAGHESQWPDLTPDGYAERERLIATAHRRVSETQAVDEREQAAKDAFLERTTLYLEQYRAHEPQAQISVIDSALHDLRATFDLMDTSSEQGWTDIDARLADLPQALTQYRATLSEEAERGNIAPARQLREVAAQVRGWTGQTGSNPSVFAGLVEPASKTPLGDQLSEHAAAATAAVAEFGVWLETELAPRGRSKEAVGPEQYARASRYFLGAAVDLDETYAWGWDELARIEDQMRQVADRIVPGGSVDEAVAALDADPARNLPSKEAFRDWMQELADTTIAELAGVHFDIPDPVRRIEAMIAPTTDGGVYYTGPSEDFSRPGRMWWSVPEETTTFSTWREVTTVYHEGVPGHHLQVGQTTARKELLNRFLRTMCWVSGSGEGWALYAERLMDDLGYLEDPGDKLGMLDSQGFRAARVIVDIGVHLELEVPDNPFGFHPGQRWTPELVWEFMRAHSRMGDAELRFEVDRYLGWPGQAPSYKVGERLWLQAREQAKQRKGAAFDLKQFHTDALNLGSIGLDPLTKALARL